MTLSRDLIVDDEALARRRIRRLLTAEPDVDVVGECARRRVGVDADRQRQARISCCSTSRCRSSTGSRWFSASRRRTLPAIIFVTAFDRYALRAFDVHAIDYLLKPFTRERFRVGVGRARGSASHGTRRTPGLVALVDELRAAGALPQARRRSLPRTDRAACSSRPSTGWKRPTTTSRCTSTAASTWCARRWRRSRRQLDPGRFVRIHRSTIVQIDRIAELHPATHGDILVRLHDGSELTVSRTWRERLERCLGRTLQF